MLCLFLSVSAFVLEVMLLFLRTRLFWLGFTPCTRLAFSLPLPAAPSLRGTSFEEDNPTEPPAVSKGGMFGSIGDNRGGTAGAEAGPGHGVAWASEVRRCPYNGVGILLGGRSCILKLRGMVRSVGGGVALRNWRGWNQELSFLFPAPMPGEAWQALGVGVSAAR